ncbi:MAG TPA: GNAT family N-acetyltransferase [Sphingopyxis sp.]|nr:GNAT family N-acetyltransferase [Sphingopyxis sp.]
MTEVEYRRIGADDATSFDRIAEDVFDEPVDAARLSAYLAEPGHLMLLALVSGEVVGQCAAVIHRHPDKPAELYIDEVGVCPRFQRRGIARGMMDAMIAWGRERGCEEAWVGTETDNVPARALYARHAEAEPFVMYLWDL